MNNTREVKARPAAGIGVKLEQNVPLRAGFELGQGDGYHDVLLSGVPQ